MDAAPIDDARRDPGGAVRAARDRQNVGDAADAASHPGARSLDGHIAAMTPTSTATLRRWHERVGAKPDHVKAMIDSVMEGLSDGPRTQQELIARAEEGGKGVRAWLEHAWSAVRPAVIDGLIVYGPPRGAEATFVRVDTWLPKQPAFEVADARAELLRRFLSAFGPATAHDFAKWSGLKTSDAKSRGDRRETRSSRCRSTARAGWIRRADPRRSRAAARRGRRAAARRLRSVPARARDEGASRRAEALQARLPPAGLDLAGRPARRHDRRRLVSADAGKVDARRRAVRPRDAGVRQARSSAKPNAMGRFSGRPVRRERIRFATARRHTSARTSTADRYR